ncbi:transcriptional activator GLI3 isoform X2 [Phlebotomus argentipes]|uniref:transcriptional activator GLI3 isoform X2 n=1 Tax=Phlebotomus argentipes TaxID=94469 RepID=UPI002893595B|nr:transcriptional activator GLI3 isoform X2 [Phlebotomus argentipes]
MAVFLINICKFNGCGITFPNLYSLIQHIEDTHIDYDPKAIELKEQQQPPCLPLSYVLRFITDAARKEASFLATSGADIKRKLTTKHHNSYSASSSNRSNTPTGSEMDEEEMMVSESEDSNDSWTTEEFSSEFIMRYGSRHSGNQGSSSLNEKPFACPVPGCKKRYKNVNGIKYHSKNGHKKDGKVRKGYKCHCGKSYKTSQGLKSHTVLAHNTTSMGAQPPGSVSPTGSNCSNTSGSSNCISQGTGQSGGTLSAPQLNTNGSIQLSPTSPLSSITVSGGNSVSSSPLKNSFGLITIKAKPGLVGVTNKLVKLVPEIPVSGGDKIGKTLDARSLGVPVTAATATKMSLPGLVNLGILTPATSPKPLSQLPTQSSVAQPQQQQLSVPSQQTGQATTTATATVTAELLPLTPISPNMSVNFTTPGTSKSSSDDT